MTPADPRDRRSGKPRGDRRSNAPHDDKTIIVARPATVTPNTAIAWPIGIAAALVISAVALYVLQRPEPPHALQPPALEAPSLQANLADEAAILAEQPAALTATRWSGDRDVLVLDFPDADEQGHMLNRVAALIEKAAAPRDRILGAEEMAALLARSGDTNASFYAGHDYSAAALARFFALAARDHTALDPGEQRLHDIADSLGWLAPGAVGALISVVAAGPQAATTRATILHHELSHGLYFTRPDYAAATRQLWEVLMTADERSRFRAWLGSEGYDEANEDLMMNECQAYLVWTPNPAFFQPAMVGLTPTRAAALRTDFIASRPDDARGEQP